MKVDYYHFADRHLYYEPKRKIFTYVKADVRREGYIEVPFISSIEVKKKFYENLDFKEKKIFEEFLKLYKEIYQEDNIEISDEHIFLWCIDEMLEAYPKTMNQFDKESNLIVQNIINNWRDENGYW